MQIVIRPVEPSDLDSVCEIERRSFPHPWRASEFRLFYNRVPYGFLVAVMNGRVVGYVIAEISKFLEPRKFQLGKRGHLLNIAVEPELRAQGIGKALMKAIFKHLRGEGVREVCLEVQASNLAAKSFYLRMGFIEKGRKARYYPNEDAVVMVKKL